MIAAIVMYISRQYFKLTTFSLLPLKLTLQSHGRSSCHSSWDPPPPPWSSSLQLWSSLLFASGQNKTYLTVFKKSECGKARLRWLKICSNSEYLQKHLGIIVSLQVEKNGDGFKCQLCLHVLQTTPEKSQRIAGPPVRPHRLAFWICE